MDNLQYIGEHLLPGQIGHFAILLGFISALVAALAYFFATNRRLAPEQNQWKNIGRWSFFLHTASLLTIIGAFFHILVNNYYEYHYVWANTSESLPFKYIFSAFWKDQEGSFLLWLFWHAVLGLILVWKSKEWESPVLAIISVAQAVIISMILGIYPEFLEEPFKIGSNPFVLLRDVMEAPIFSKEDYLTLIEGNGLNPLLQNYWMTIHPPTLFLGFASTIVPFAFAVGGLWTKQYREWLKPALPWALFSGAILGLGILMGGAWAYEALTFGGYWAWDPVENMSLVPWLLLIAGIHTHLVSNATGHSIRSTILLYILTFIMILYSTFLTRSGVLGETSVHSFTEIGLETQLLLLIVVFVIIGLVPFFLNYKKIPAPQKEESITSKEFWMFLGSLVLLFSGAMITASTSLPVYNKIRQIFDEGYMGQVINDPVDHYNRYQLWIALFIGLLSGGAQFLRYREFNWSRQAGYYFKHLLIAAISAIILTILFSLWINAHSWQFVLLLFSALFTVTVNIDYIFSFLKFRLKAAGSAFSHIGFGLMIVGIMASGLNKYHISTNELVMRDLLDEERLKKNIILYRGVPIYMSGYEVTYVKDTLQGHYRYFQVDFTKLDEKGQKGKTFTLMPNVLYDNQFTKVAAVNPDTRHYLDRDIYTHVASLPAAQISMDEAKAVEDSLDYRTYEASIGDTIAAQKHKVVITNVKRDAIHPDYDPEAGDLALGVRMEFHRAGIDSTWIAEPLIVLRGQLVYTFPVQIDQLGVKVKPEEGIFDKYLTLEDSIDYDQFTFSQGEEIKYKGYSIRFAGFNKEIEHPDYIPEKNDIAVSAIMEVKNEEEAHRLEPVYLIRDNQSFNFKDNVPGSGIHMRFSKINPSTETIEMNIAIDKKAGGKVPVQIAENATRNDFIVLEAIVFPGINFFWIGTLLMLFGLALSMWKRISKQTQKGR